MQTRARRVYQSKECQMAASKARTCQMMGLSVLKYFKNLFAAIAAGRTDYENM